MAEIPQKRYNTTNQPINNNLLGLLHSLSTSLVCMPLWIGSYVLQTYFFSSQLSWSPRETTESQEQRLLGPSLPWSLGFCWFISLSKLSETLEMAWRKRVCLFYSYNVCMSFSPVAKYIHIIEICTIWYSRMGCTWQSCNWMYCIEKVSIVCLSVNTSVKLYSLVSCKYM